MNPIEQTAQFLFKAVKRAKVDPATVRKGDYIIITGANRDVAGDVVNTDTVKGTISITLNTGRGNQIVKVSNENFIHIIQRADMLNMRNHIEYERDLKDVDKGTHTLTEKDQRPEYGPVETSEKSELPTSKISLVMKTQKNDNVGAVMAAVNTLNLFTLDSKGKQEIADYTGLDLTQVNRELDIIEANSRTVN